jgi:hypothetical protein
MTSGKRQPITPPVTPPQKNPWPGFRRHFTVYAATCLMLIALNIGLGEPQWALYVLAGWGIGLAAHGLACYLERRDQTDPERI